MDFYDALRLYKAGTHNIYRAGWLEATPEPPMWDHEAIHLDGADIMADDWVATPIPTTQGIVAEGFDHSRLHGDPPSA